MKAMISVVLLAMISVVTLIEVELSAREYRANVVNNSVVYGHRIGPGGQEMLVTKN